MTTVPTHPYHQNEHVSPKDVLVAQFGPYDVYDYCGAHKLYTIVWGPDDNVHFCANGDFETGYVNTIIEDAPDKAAILAVIAFISFEKA